MHNVKSGRQVDGAMCGDGLPERIGVALWPSPFAPKSPQVQPWVSPAGNGAKSDATAGAG